ncbi:kinase domain protein [Rhizoctonia solani 123E]|uniref:Kinase domain protein n=2 Tax=Rhizoctonia solani AG-3 TaxID=1086053 RepID=A0A074S447_9AGAM|nr:kinase domain protein [Rhizoctonia solani 123E]
MAKGFRAAPSMSTAAYHPRFKQQQENSNIPIYNGRPYERTSIPIQLFHPAFDFFTTELEKSDELIEDKCAIVEKLMFGSQALYNTETDRWSAIKGLLIGAVGHPIFKDSISRCQSGGVVTFTEPNSARKAYGAVVELNNEIGTGHSDPWVQSAQSYARYWSQLEMTELRRATRCPTFIISIAGPWMCVSGAVYLDRVVIQPLTDYVWLGNHPQQNRHLVRVTRLFMAISRAVSFLKEYYTPLIKPNAHLSVERYRDSPCITSLAGAINFTYIRRLGDPGIIRPIFEAITEDGRPIVVKFAQVYNLEAHKLLASQSLAPQLLSLEVEPVGGGLAMVVMELTGTSLDNYLDPTGPGLEPSARAQICKDVETALDLLHANNLVFGDLRPPNVLVVQGNNGLLRGRLVDFEWCGVEGEARYPAGMNQSKEIGWAPGAVKGSRLFKEHDRHMLDKLFSTSSVEDAET